MKTNFLLAAFTAATATLSFAADSVLDRADKEFLKDAYEDGLAEVHLGELSKMSASKEVKDLGAIILADHTKLNAEIKTLADSKKVELAADRTALAKGKHKMLEQKTGAEFNKSWAESARDGHKTTLKDFEKAAGEAKDADVKAFAAKTVPMLKEHLSKAEALAQQTGNK